MTYWYKQPLDSVNSWFARRVVAQNYIEQLPLNVSGMNAALQTKESLLKDDRTTTVARLDIDNQSLVIKRYNPRSHWHKIKRALRRTRADRCWQMSYALAEAGLNVAHPILMLEQRFGPIRLNAYFVNELLEGEELMTALPRMGAEDQQLVKQAIAEAFDKMKHAMITHGDLKASNLIWKDSKLYFIDLDAAQVHRSNSTWLKANKKDRKRFLKNWNNSPELLALFDRFLL